MSKVLVFMKLRPLANNYLLMVFNQSFLNAAKVRLYSITLYFLSGNSSQNIYSYNGFDVGQYLFSLVTPSKIYSSNSFS